MNSRRNMKAFTDAAAHAVAREIGGMRRETGRERELRDAEFRARLAELDARIASVAAIEQRVADRLASLKDGVNGADGAPGLHGVNGVDGKDGAPGADGQNGIDGRNGIDGKDGRDGIDGAPGEAGKDGTDGRDGVDGKDGLDGKDGRDGRDVDDITLVQDGAALELAFQVGDVRTVFEIELPAGPAGSNGSDGRDGEPGERGPEGYLKAAEPWCPGVHYDGEVRTHAGATWQALKDTAEEPGSEDWTCLAARGADGRDGASFNPRRLWVADDDYFRLDVVALNGGAFVALKDNPGPCPGEGWMLISQPGKRGERGEKGDRGDRGERGPAGETVVAMSVDDQGMLTLTNGDGSRVQCDLYPILVRAASAKA